MKVLSLASHPEAHNVREHASALARQREQERAAKHAAENHWQGERWQRGRGLKDVAKDVRRDIREAVKTGSLPKDFKASVRISRYSMGQSLDVEILSHSRADDSAGYFVDGIQRICARYNYDRSDTMADYFDTEFYVNVRFSS